VHRLRDPCSDPVADQLSSTVPSSTTGNADGGHDGIRRSKVGSHTVVDTLHHGLVVVPSRPGVADR